MRRPIVLLLFATIFVAELGWSGVTPLLPSYAGRYGLSDVATGMILMLSSFGILLVSLPASALSRRFAVRTLTLWGVGALATGNLLVGLSHGYGLLLVGRGLFGIGLGTMWVTGAAWLHEAAGEDAPRALAATTAVIGIGSLVGPSIVGDLAQRFSLGIPFVALGLLTGATGLILVLVPSTHGRVSEQSPPLREMVRAARADHLMLTSLVLTLAASTMWMTVDLMVPFRLHAEGFSPREIGWAFSAASIAFAVASVLTARVAQRAATVRVAAIWTLLLGAGLSIVAAEAGVPATLVFLVIAGATSGVMISLTYPLGVTGASQGGFSVAVVGALLNMVWATSGILGPLSGGVVMQNVGDRPAFLALATISFAASWWMWARRDRPRAPEPI